MARPCATYDGLRHTLESTTSYPCKELNSLTQVGEITWKRRSSRAHKVNKGMDGGEVRVETGPARGGRGTRGAATDHRKDPRLTPPAPKSDTKIYLTCHTRWAGNSNSLTHDTQPRRRQPRYGADQFFVDGTPRPRRAVANLGSPRVKQREPTEQSDVEKQSTLSFCAGRRPEAPVASIALL